jgi:hypothetical protein
MDRGKHKGSNLISFGRVLPNTFTKLRPLEDCSAAKDKSEIGPELVATRMHSLRI